MATATIIDVTRVDSQYPRALPPPPPGFRMAARSFLRVNGVDVAAPPGVRNPHPPLAPGFALAYSNLGAVEFKQGDLDAAERHFERAIALQPSLWLAHYNLCAMRFQQGRLEDARRSCEESLRQGGDDRVSAGLARVREAMLEHQR